MRRWPQVGNHGLAARRKRARILPVTRTATICCMNGPSSTCTSAHSTAHNIQHNSRCRKCLQADSPKKTKDQLRTRRLFNPPRQRASEEEKRRLITSSEATRQLLLAPRRKTVARRVAVRRHLQAASGQSRPKLGASPSIPP